MKLQKIIFVTIIVIVLVFIAEYLKLDSNCISSKCLDVYNSVLLGWLIMSVITLLLASFLFFFQEKVLRMWWKFARIAIPVILVISTVINLGFHHTVGGFLNMSDMFDIPAQMLMYSIFVIGSVIQIVRGYRVRK